MIALRPSARLTSAAAIAAAVAVTVLALAAPRAHAVSEAKFTIVANQTAANAGENFNGVERGRLTITVAPGTPVHIAFSTSKSAALSHSFQVVPLKGETLAPTVPAQAEAAPAFAGAQSPNPVLGTAPGKSADIRFTASKAGHYLFICGFPGHALIGMWGRFDVTPGAKPAMVTAK